MTKRWIGLKTPSKESEKLISKIAKMEHEIDGNETMRLFMEKNAHIRKDWCVYEKTR